MHRTPIEVARVSKLRPQQLTKFNLGFVLFLSKRNRTPLGHPEHVSLVTIINPSPKILQNHPKKKTHPKKTHLLLPVDWKNSKSTQTTQYPKRLIPKQRRKIQREHDIDTFKDDDANPRNNAVSSRDLPNQDLDPIMQNSAYESNTIDQLAKQAWVRFQNLTQLPFDGKLRNNKQWKRSETSTGTPDWQQSVLRWHAALYDWSRSTIVTSVAMSQHAQISVGHSNFTKVFSF